MREILFRGKRKDNGEWVYGDLIQLLGKQGKGRKFIINNKFGACIDDKGNFINTETPFVNEVLPETVGQYCGLDDKNGKKIFEGDILKPPLFLDNEQRPCVCIYNQKNNVDEIIGFGLYWKNEYFGRYQDIVPSDEWDEFEVIGTIFDKEVK